MKLRSSNLELGYFVLKTFWKSWQKSVKKLLEELYFKVSKDVECRQKNNLLSFIKIITIRDCSHITSARTAEGEGVLANSDFFCSFGQRLLIFFLKRRGVQISSFLGWFHTWLIPYYYNLIFFWKDGLQILGEFPKNLNK